MILGIEIVLLIYGIYALIKGSYNIGKDRKVTGNKARILGLVSLTPLPLSLFIGLIGGVLIALSNNNQLANPLIYTVIEIVIVVGVLITIFVLSKQFYKQQESQQQDDFYSSEF